MRSFKLFFSKKEKFYQKKKGDDVLATRNKFINCAKKEVHSTILNPPSSALERRPLSTPEV